MISCAPVAPHRRSNAVAHKLARHATLYVCAQEPLRTTRSARSVLCVWEPDGARAHIAPGSDKICPQYIILNGMHARAWRISVVWTPCILFMGLMKLTSRFVVVDCAVGGEESAGVLINQDKTPYFQCVCVLLFVLLLLFGCVCTAYIELMETNARGVCVCT